MTFSAVYNNKCQRGKIAVRRAQFKLAEKSAAMAIYLGKVLLGQDDTPNHGSQNEEPVIIEMPNGDSDEN